MRGGAWPSRRRCGRGGSFTRFEYSQTFGQHWRATASLAWIRGDMTDFLGEYRRNQLWDAGDPV